MNWFALDTKLQGRCKDSRKVGNNTYLIRRGEGYCRHADTGKPLPGTIVPEDDIAVRLHYTDVVTFKCDGDIVLSSGGFHTRTTKDRINQYLQQRRSGEKFFRKRILFSDRDQFSFYS